MTSCQLSREARCTHQHRPRRHRLSLGRMEQRVMLIWTQSTAQARALFQSRLVQGLIIPHWERFTRLITGPMSAVREVIRVIGCECHHFWRGAFCVALRPAILVVVSLVGKSLGNATTWHHR
jgi:hypothetical protein